MALQLSWNASLNVLLIALSLFTASKCSPWQDINHVLSAGKTTECNHLQSVDTVQRCILENGTSILPAKEMGLPSPSVCEMTSTKDGRPATMACYGDGILIELDPSYLKMTTNTHTERAKRQILPIITGVLGIAKIFVDIVCVFVCEKNESPPPNHPPSIMCPSLVGSSTIRAEPRKLTAVVSWTNPTANDPEDGNLEVETQPTSFASGREYKSGNYIVTFTAKDKQGLLASCSLFFNVEVIRCNPPRWPLYGTVTCGEIIYGNTCKVTCDVGYTLKEGTLSTITCTESGQWDSDVFNCIPRKCKPMPTIEHGELVCPPHKDVYGELCFVSCSDGFTLIGHSYMTCNEDGDWGKVSECKDSKVPQVLSCPPDFQVYIDDANNTASVTWDLPQATDNYDPSPNITEVHGFSPGQRFQAGTHRVTYSVSDASGNRGPNCQFTIAVLTLNCEPPDLQVNGARFLQYQCPNLYRLGAVCRLSCKSGYPLVGVDSIQCLAELGSNPPHLRWTWDQSGIGPSCLETYCPALPAPGNGALACQTWDHGDMCQIQCQQGYDVPLLADGNYVCGHSDGQWRPDHNIPNCNKVRRPSEMHLPSDLYYYTGTCNSSKENLLQIQNNFVQALNQSKYHEKCIGVKECRAEFVNVTCGQITARRRRDSSGVLLGRHIRSALLAYIVEFDLIIPYTINTNTTSNAFSSSSDILDSMADIIEKEIKDGVFNISNADMHLQKDSFARGSSSFMCPRGMASRPKTSSCVGCPNGKFMPENSQQCETCPQDTFQIEENSVECTKCPEGKGTFTTGANSSELCLDFCTKGHFSPTGLAPCMPCQVGSFMSTIRGKRCLPCPKGKSTIVTGSSSHLDCKDFDIEIPANGSSSIRKSHDVIHSMTFSAWVYLTENSTSSKELIRIGNAHANRSLHLVHALVSELIIDGSVTTITPPLPVMEWFHVALTLSGVSHEAAVYVNGKQTTRASFSGTDAVAKQELISFSGGMLLSSFQIYDRLVTAADIGAWADKCGVNETSMLFTAEDISDGYRTIIPSKCDDLDECASNPCGKYPCRDKLRDFECMCSDGYTGKQCEVHPDFCLTNACQNGAICLTGDTNYTCKCQIGFKGSKCEKAIVNGDWSEWSLWGQCSSSCGGGLQTRTRRCDSPPPDPDGKTCSGHTNETHNCNTEECPDCPRLVRSFGTYLTCNESASLKTCTISCRPGMYFASPPLPYYKCGDITGFKWNHQTDDNPSGKLPSCSTSVAPVQMSVNFEGNYDLPECDGGNAYVISSTLNIRSQSLSCVSTGSCQASTSIPNCGAGKTKRSADSSVNIHLTVHLGEINDLKLDQLFDNKTVSSSLLKFLSAIKDIETSAQEIYNNSQTFFKVDIDGRNHTIRSDALHSTNAAQCRSGFVPREMLCVECPKGSKQAEDFCQLCNRGLYQDETAKTYCKPCPVGRTTAGVGSDSAMDCSVPATKSTEVKKKEEKQDENNKTTIIAVTIAVVGCVAIVAITAFAYKKLKTKKQQVGDSFVSLPDADRTTVGKTSYMYMAKNM